MLEVEQLEGASMDPHKDPDCSECQGEDPDCIVCRGGRSEGQPPRIQTKTPAPVGKDWNGTGFGRQQPDASQLPLF
jgi:hypothetical protein